MYQAVSCVKHYELVIFLCEIVFFYFVRTLRDINRLKLLLLTLLRLSRASLECILLYSSYELVY